MKKLSLGYLGLLVLTIAFAISGRQANVPSKGVSVKPAFGTKRPTVPKGFQDPTIPTFDRVIGVPGERLMIRNRQVYLDGKPMDEKYKVTP